MKYDFKTLQMKDRKGITLVELIIVVSIVGILVIALGFSFQGWQGNYKIESQTKNLYTDMADAITLAMTRNAAHFVVLEAGQYQIFRDANSDNTYDAGDTALWTAPKALDAGLRLNIDSGDALPQTITIESRGLMSPQYDFFIDSTSEDDCCLEDGTCSAAEKLTCLDPDYDCVIVTQARLRMGKYDITEATVGEKCDEK